MIMIGKKIQQQVQYWRLYAKVLPLAFLGTLFLLHTIGWDSVIQKILVCGGTIMFASAIVWWYWVLKKIHIFAGTLNKATDTIENIAKEVKSIKTDIQNDLDNR